MNLTALDWSIVGLLLIGLVAMLLYCQRYVRSTADFLAANRCAGRYILAIAQGIAGLGAISVVAFFEQYYAAGFSPDWWGMLYGPVGMLLAAMGWVYFRFRETRALTMAQFFEVRYSRKFRIFAGFLAFASGLVNYGIFPAVTARFFIYYCGLPATYSWFFGIELDTYISLLAFMMFMGAFFAICGGQVAIMVTDFIQGIFCNIVFLVILLYLIFRFDLSNIFDPLLVQSAENPDASMLNPFHTGSTKGFNYFFYLIGLFSTFYGAGAWLGAQGYAVSAKSAHEAKMATFLGTWRGIAQAALLMFIPIVAYAVMHQSGAEFTAISDSVNNTLASIPDSTIRTQATVPITLVNLLPPGLIGVFAAVMFAAALSTDNTYMHSWGSILIQDVIMPFRSKPFGPKAHLWVLRAAIVGVALFAFCFSIVFKQTQYILLFFALTGAIFLGGAGSAIIGGLYTRTGTTLGAWVAMSSGAILSVTSVLLGTFWEDWQPGLARMTQWQWVINNPKEFPIDGQVTYFFAMVTALSLYIIVSVIDRAVTRAPLFNLERMLHRGPWAVQSEHQEVCTNIPRILRAFGVTPEFTRGDRWILYLTLFWTFGWFAVFFIGLASHIAGGVSDEVWAGFWKYRLVLIVFLGFVTTIWFLIGGVKNIYEMFGMLSKIVRNDSDDGRVVGGRNAGETLIIDNVDALLKEEEAEAQKK